MLRDLSVTIANMYALLTRYKRWLGEWKWLWWALAVCLFATVPIVIALPYGAEVVERIVRGWGLLLQLVAIGTALAGLLNARLQFGRPTIASVIRSWWLKAPWRKSPPSVISGNAYPGGMTASGRIYSWSETVVTEPQESRIAALEQQVNMLHELWKTDYKNFTAELSAMRASLQADSHLHQSSIAATQLQVDRFALEGIPVAACGLLCALFGSFLSAASVEIAKFLQ